MPASLSSNSQAIQAPAVSPSGASPYRSTPILRACFQVLLAAPPAIDAEQSPPWEEVVRALRYHPGVQQPDAVEFALPSHFAPRDARLAAFACDLFEPGRPLLPAALALMGRIHGRMDYAPKTTDVATDALQVLAKGQGVCQDFAHLMIGVMRSMGLAARYISGYLLTQPPPGQPRLIDGGWTL